VFSFGDGYTEKILPHRVPFFTHTISARAVFLGSLFLGTIRSSDLSKWRDERLKTTSPATVNRLLNLLSHVFTVAAQDWGMGGLINPVQNVRRPKNPPARERRLFPGETERIIAATGSQSIGNLISTNLQPDPYGQLQAVLSAHGPAYASTSGPSGTRPLLELGSARLSNRANQILL